MFEHLRQGVALYFKPDTFRQSCSELGMLGQTKPQMTILGHY